MRLVLLRQTHILRSDRRKRRKIMENEEFKENDEHTKYFGKMVKYVMIKNCVSIICFTILAIVFDKWWIAIFAILFLESVKSKTD